MATFQRRRSKITSFTGDILQPAFREGNMQAQKSANFPKLTYGSGSCNGDTPDDDSLMFEFERRYPKQAVRTPMKKLLAKEMSRETESKRRSPSIIARLMGLDVFPASQASDKRNKRSAQNYQSGTDYAEKTQKSATSSGRRSFRKSSKEEQEFKDVFEVLQTSKMESYSNLLQKSTNSKHSEAEMLLIKQKVMEVECLSTDGRFQDSMEFQDAHAVLDPNEDLLLKFLQQPDSLFTKHLHDLGTSPQSHFGHRSAMTPSHAQKYESSDLQWKAERETQWKNHCKSSQKHLDSLCCHSTSEHAAQSLNKPTIVQLEGTEDPSVLPTRIVVLKPNLGKVQNATGTVSSPLYCHAYPSDSRKHTELPGIKNRETETWEKKNFPDDVGFSRHKSRESRQLAKEITCKMRNNLSSVPTKFSSSRIKGYAGDDSCSNLSGNESANGLEVKTMTSKNGFVRHRRSRSSSSHSSESSASREAKKRLSERWKMSHKSQELGVVNRGCTLGEMLALSDREVRPADVEAMIDQGKFDDKCDVNSGSVGWVEPLGISSRDGWKDDGIRKLTRSRSLPSSSTLGSPKISMHYESFRDDRYMIPKKTVKRERDKTVKGNFNRREGSSSRSSRSSRKKFLSSQCTSMKSNDASPETHFSRYQVESNFKEEDPSEGSVIVSEPSPSIVAEKNSVPDNVLDVGYGNTILPSGSPNPEFSAPLFLYADSSTGDLDVVSSKEPSDGTSKEVPVKQPILELESSASSKESNQPSPVSILEAPFVDDSSCGSEYFESVSADLHGLRMQLQLLKLDKMDSDAYAEGTMHISSDEDEEEKSVGFIDEENILKDEENWEYSYVVDILIHSGFNDVHPDKFMTTCHSPECPVSSSVFEELEKKYSNLTSLSRSARKLMFDFINDQLLEIHHHHLTDPHPWVRIATRAKSNRKENGLPDHLYALLTSQRTKADKDAGEKVLGRESQWLDIGSDIDVIGKEIEVLLIDELVADVLAM